MKVGIKFKIDVMKIKKELLFIGKTGKYLDCTTFIDLDQTDQYGNNGFVVQDVKKEAREAGEKGPIIGNGKVFYKEGAPSQASQPAQRYAAQHDPNDDSIPF